MNTGTTIETEPGRRTAAAAPGWVREAARELGTLLVRPPFYVGVATLALGIAVTYTSQSYLHAYVTEVKTLPVLSDMILDNLPYWDISAWYDWGSLASFFIFLAYIVRHRRWSYLPYYLILCGLFHLVRGVFIVLTPFGNPPQFHGTGGPFNGFANFEFGVYPSGHTGINFLYLLLAADRRYRWALGTCFVVVVVALFLSRAHYSIDVLSGVFFAYALKAFGDRHILARTLPPAGDRPAPAHR